MVSYCCISRKIDTNANPLHILLTDTEEAGGYFMRRRRRTGGGATVYVLAFGCGLLAGFLFPARFMVAVLVVALLLCCLSCGRC